MRFQKAENKEDGDVIVNHFQKRNQYVKDKEPLINFPN